MLDLVADAKPLVDAIREHTAQLSRVADVLERWAQREGLAPAYGKRCDGGLSPVAQPPEELGTKTWRPRTDAEILAAQLDAEALDPRMEDMLARGE